MGSLLATVFLAVPLIAWLCGALLLDDSQPRLARFSHAPRGIFPNYRKSNFLRSRAFESPSGPGALDEVKP